MQQRKYDPKPGSNQREAPHTTRQTPEGKECVWFKPKSAPPPEKYDYSVSHTGRANWRVYFLLVCSVLVPICLLVWLIVGIGSM